MLCLHFTTSTLCFLTKPASLYMIKTCLYYKMAYSLHDWFSSMHRTVESHLPRPVSAFSIVIACICLSICVCVFACVSDNHQLLPTVFCHLFSAKIAKLGSELQNTLVWIHVVWGWIDLDFQIRIELKSKIFPNCELIRTITLYQLRLGLPDLDQQCILALLRSLFSWASLILHFIFFQF